MKVVFNPRPVGWLIGGAALCLSIAIGVSDFRISEPRRTLALEKFALEQESIRAEEQVATDTNIYVFDQPKINTEKNTAKAAAMIARVNHAKADKLLNLNYKSELAMRMFLMQLELDPYEAGEIRNYHASKWALGMWAIFAVIILSFRKRKPNSQLESKK